jgi:hypothetical protein
VLLFSKHGHHDQRVQVDSLTQHPEVVTAKQVQEYELGHLATGLWTARGTDIGTFTESNLTDSFIQRDLQVRLGMNLQASKFAKTNSTANGGLQSCIGD